MSVILEDGHSAVRSRGAHVLNSCSRCWREADSCEADSCDAFIMLQEDAALGWMPDYGAHGLLCIDGAEPGTRFCIVDVHC